ncbi:E3 ubiquitin-protein ligase TRIM56-like [Patiria miniata]|uniref:Uncharacterized protein n=1 Tax=Patiria miniata TaxID=46514 RepID=A0A913ZES8_PATMI|nr:E3 ubiquitin-protein ligase TRIM56-like [Patiria miniata]
MAAALEKISDHLECNICQDRYEQPKILDCLHSFCEKCLEKYYTSRYGGEPKIPCPVCRRETVLPETLIQGLKTNFHLMGIVEEVSLQEKVSCSENAKAICEICDEKNEALHRCLECAQNVCPNCHKTHLRFSANSNHTVATLEDIRQGKVTVKKTSEDAPKCQKHKGEVRRFYCKTCEELICRDCTVVDHCKPDHCYIDSGEASFKYKETLKDVFTNFEKGIDGLQLRLFASSRAKQKLAQNITTTLETVQNRAAKMMDHVKSQEKKISDELKQLQEDRNRVYDEHDKTVNMMLKARQHSLLTSKEVTNTASDGDFLSLHPIICKELKSLKGQNPPQIDPKLSYLSFTKGQKIGNINLGTLEVQACKWEMCHEFRNQVRGAGDFTDITATQSGKMAVTDFSNNHVVICSTEGKHRENIGLNARPLAAAFVPNQNLLVVVEHNKCVTLYNTDEWAGFPVLTEPKGEDDKTQVDPQSVAVREDGTILVGDVKRMVWTEHRPIDGEILHTIPVKTPPTYLAVHDDADRVMVSGGITRKVDITDRKGNTLSTIKPTIHGKPVSSCRGVCCDRSGIYLAMRNEIGTGHIHHYDLDGRFLDCLVHQGLNDPRGMTFTSNGKLAVVEGNSVKVYHRV